MQRILLLFTAALCTFPAQSQQGQSCPTITSVTVTQNPVPLSSDNYIATVNYVNAGGSKSIHLMVSGPSGTCLNQCINFNEAGSGSQTFSFSCPGGVQTYTATAYSGANCNGNACGNLPIVLKSFNAEKTSDGNAKISFSITTSSIESPSRAYLEYSEDGITFSDVQSIDLNKETGTYSFQERNRSVSQQIAYYRLRLQETASTYRSKITSIKFATLNKISHVVKGSNLYLYEVPEGSTVAIFNLLGRKQFSITGSGYITIPIGNLPKGPYLFRVTTKNRMHTGKFLKP